MRKPRYLRAEVKKRRDREKVRAFYGGLQWTPNQVGKIKERIKVNGGVDLYRIEDPFRMGRDCAPPPEGIERLNTCRR